MKKCNKCGNLLDESNFYKVHVMRGTGKIYFRNECKSCFNTICNKNGREIKYKRVRENKAYSLSKLGGECFKCGESAEKKLHFHHLDPLKKISEIGELKKYTGYKGRIELDKELSKCIILCQPCHAEAHRELRRNKLARSFKN